MKNTDIRFILSFLFYGKLHKKPTVRTEHGLWQEF